MYIDAESNSYLPAFKTVLGPQFKSQVESEHSRVSRQATPPPLPSHLIDNPASPIHARSCHGSPPLFSHAHPTPHMHMHMHIQLIWHCIFFVYALAKQQKSKPRVGRVGHAGPACESETKWVVGGWVRGSFFVSSLSSGRACLESVEHCTHRGRHCTYRARDGPGQCP